jgi:tetratricopeptide (TPR) repeat protein/ABC-type branched-subunit amino acid transport system ATPase component
MVPSKAGLNRLLAQILTSDADIDGFVGRCFPNLVRRVARGSDGPAKIGVLVENTDPKLLLDRLSIVFAAQVAKNEHLLDEDKLVAGAAIPDAGPLFGRSEALADLVANACQDKPSPTLLIGPAGIGKTTLALGLLHAAASVERFGGRRYLAQLDTAHDEQSMHVAIARAIDTVPQAPLRAQIVQALRRAPALLVLDDVDVALSADATQVQALFAELAGIEGVAIVATSRNETSAIAGARTVAVAPLAAAAARETVTAIVDGGAVDAIVGAASGNPLVLTALSHAARGGWDAATNASSPKTHAEATAIVLSLPPHADGFVRILPLLGVLTNGVSAEDNAALPPTVGVETCAVLRSFGLATNAGGRIRLRRAVREGVDLNGIREEDVVRATYHYTSVALTHGPKVGWPDAEPSAQRLAHDSDNIEEMIMRGFNGPHRIAAIDAAVAIATFIGSSGHCTSKVIEAARESSQRNGDKLGEADCTQALGDIALARHQSDDARKWFIEALPLFDKAHAGLSIAACLVRLGDLALERGDLDDAQARFTAAIPAYRSILDKFGEATVIKSLAELAAQRNNHQDARKQFQEALNLFEAVDDKTESVLCRKGIADAAFNLQEHDDARAIYEDIGPIFEQIGDRISQTECLHNLGDIAFARGRHAAATAFYQKELPLLKVLGDKLGEGACMAALGDVALATSEIEDAQAYYHAALPLLRAVDEKYGMANCIQSLGDIALTRMDQDTARDNYEQSLFLFLQLKDGYSLGWTHYRLAQVAGDPEIFKSHILEARDAWQSVGREELIKEMAEEFPGVLP